MRHFDILKFIYNIYVFREVIDEPAKCRSRTDQLQFLSWKNKVETPHLLLPDLNLATPKRLKSDVCFSILSLAMNDKEDLCSLWIKMNRNTAKTTFKPISCHKNFCQHYLAAVLFKYLGS